MQVTDQDAVSSLDKSSDDSDEITIGIIVAGRNELCALSRWLFSHVPLDLLQRPGDPVKVSVNGTECGGKKIIPDATREYFFTWDKEFEGKPEYEEYVDTPNLSFAFVNSNWNPKSFSSKALSELSSNQAIVNQVLSTRHNGGIVFIHNALQPLDWADISIELRSEADIKFNVADPSYRDELREKIMKVPHKDKQPGGDGIQRLVRITIKNEAIANSDVMKRLLDTVAEQQPAFRTAIENDRDVLSGQAQECDYVVFDPAIFKPRVHKLSTDPMTWQNAPMKVKPTFG